MATTYDGDETNHPPEITIPEDGDTMDAASVTVPLEACEDNIDYIIDGETVFSGEKQFQHTITVRGGTAASNAVAIDMAAGTERKPWFAGAVGGAFHARIYTKTREGIFLPGFEFVEGAFWDDTTELWDFDSLTLAATFEGARLVEVLSTGGAAVADNHTGVTLRTKKLHIAAAFSGNFVFAAAGDTITTTGNFVTAGFVIGDVIKITGSVSNNGNHTVSNVTATVLTVGNTLVDETVAASGVVIRTAPWGQAAWDTTALGFANRLVTSTQAALPKNTLHPGNMIKAWGRYLTDGAGNVAITSGFGLASIAISGSSVRATLRNAMFDTSYLVQPSSTTASAPIARGIVISATVVEIQLYDTGGATADDTNQGTLKDQSASITSGTFIVLGDQA